MEALLEGIKKLRNTPGSSGEDQRRIREGVELAVRLAELIQGRSQAAFQEGSQAPGKALAKPARGA